MPWKTKSAIEIRLSIWEIRERSAAEIDYDIRPVGESLMEQQKQFADRLVPPPKKKKARKRAA